MFSPFANSIVTGTSGPPLESGTLIVRLIAWPVVLTLAVSVPASERLSTPTSSASPVVVTA